MSTSESKIGSINDPRTSPYEGMRADVQSLHWNILVFGLVVCDTLMVLLALRAAYWLRFELQLSFFNLTVAPVIDFYRVLMAVMLVIFIILFALNGLYDREKLLGGTQEYSSILTAVTVGITIAIAFGFFGDDLNFARGWVIPAWFFTFIFVIVERILVRRLVYFLRRHGYFIKTAIIVGANDEGKTLAEQLGKARTSGFHILGFVDKKIKPGANVIGHLTCLGNLESLNAVVDHYKVDEIILASSAISSRDKMVDIIKEYGTSKRVKVRFSSGLYEILTTGLTVNQFAYVPLVGVNSVRLTGIDKFLKKVVDLSLAFPALIIFSLPMLVIAIVIKLTSPGPAIYRRRVVGVNGIQFDAFKFRTMHVNGDEILANYPELQKELAENHKLKIDPRIIPIGKFLRKFSLDELPQLINVLRGEMSVVGPRMITPPEINKYDKLDMNLLTVRPGITGLWQVSGRSDVSYDERVRMDMYYIRNWTIWLDIQIIVQTIPAVLKSRGAY